jgi:peptidoglycan/LPS O-acetylase OafA/YrhL
MKLPNIQLLRACAALMIVVDHCGIETGRLAEANGGSKLFDEIPWGFGVPLFFAISGFIMVVTSARAFGSVAAALDFMRRRIFRIVPLYWLITTVALIAALYAPRLSNAPPGDHLYIAASYGFWPYLSLTGYARPLATPGWTLNLEMLFYVVFAVALLFPRRLGLSVLFAALGGLVAARVAGLLPGVALNFWGDPIVLGFLFGAAVGIAFNAGARLSWLPIAALATVGFAIVFLTSLPSGAEDDLAPRLSRALPALLILVAVALGPQIDDKRRIWIPALLVGDASYSLYLVHEFMLRSLSLVWFKGPFAALSLWAFLPIGFAIVVPAAILIYWCFERPATRWLNGGKAPRASTVANGFYPDHADATGTLATKILRIT